MKDMSWASLRKGCAVVLLVIVPATSGWALTRGEIVSAIAHGKHYKTKDDFLESGVEGVKVKLASAFALDGISKTAIFFDDWNYIAGESASANQQMREVNPDDFQPVGLLHAIVQVHAMGAIPTSKLNRRYLDGRAHLVLRVNGVIIQPTTKSMLKKSDQSEGAVLLGVQSGKIVLEFSFDVAAVDLQKEVEVILIDGDGNQHRAKSVLAPALGHPSSR